MEKLEIGPFRVFLGDNDMLETRVDVADRETIQLPGSNVLGMWVRREHAVEWVKAVDAYLRKFYGGAA